MSVQIYDSSDSDTSPLSTDEYDDEDDSDLMDMAVSVKPKPGASNNNISPSKSGGKSSSPTTNNQSSTKYDGSYKRPANSYKKRLQPPRLNAICKKRSLRWFKNGMRRATVRLCLKEFYLNRHQKNGENMVVASVKTTSSSSAAAAVAAGENDKVTTDTKHKLEEELRYKQQLFLQQQQQQRAFMENLQEQNQNKYALNEQQQKQEQEKLTMIEILKHVQNQERMETKSPELICLDVTEDEESPQKSESSRTPPPTPPPTTRTTPNIKAEKLPANNHLMQMKIVDIRSSVDDILICPDEDDIVEVKTEINYERTPNVQTTDLNNYEHQIPMLNYRSHTTVTQGNELKHEQHHFLGTGCALSNVSIPGIMEIEVETTSVPTANQNDTIPCVLAVPTPTTVELLSEHQMSFKLNSAQTFNNSAGIFPPHPPQVVTPMAHTPSPIRAPQTTATPQAAHMRSPIVVPSTHTTSVVTSSTPVTTSTTLPPPQIHASNMSVKRRRSTTPENSKKIPTAETSQPETSKQGQESSNLMGNTEETGNDERAAKKRMLDPTSNAEFYQKIIGLIPEYEEALSAHIQGLSQTEEKLYEAINRTNNDLAILNNVLKTKEEEWNKLLYLKRVQSELLERLVRMTGVIKAKNRGEVVPNYNMKQLFELEDALKISIASTSNSLLSPQPPREREKPATEPEREREPSASVNKITQLVTRVANMLPEDIEAHASTIKALKKQYLPNDKYHERCNNHNETNTSTRFIEETIAKQEERIKLQREAELHRKYTEIWKAEEHRRLHYENNLRLEKQRDMEHLRQLQECFEKYPDGVPEDYLTNKAKVAEIKSRQQSTPPSPTMLGRQGNVKNIIDNFRRENPQALPPPPLLKCTKPAKPETYVSNNNSSYTYTHNNVPTLMTLLSASGDGGGGGGASGSNSFGQSRSTREKYEHSGSGMAPMPKPYRPKYDTTPIDRYKEILCSSFESSSNLYKNTNSNRHSFGDLEYNRTTSRISNGGKRNSDHVHIHDNDNDICQECYKSEALWICGNCNKGRYCSRKCQLMAWDKHQDVCGE